MSQEWPRRVWTWFAESWQAPLYGDGIASEIQLAASVEDYSLSTLSIQLRYRPVRIGWCVEREDFEALRAAMRRSFTLWGGGFNPIIPVDDPVQARKLVDLFRIDCLYAASETDRVRAFIDNQAHLPWPDYQRAFSRHRCGRKKVRLCGSHGANEAGV